MFLVFRNMTWSIKDYFMYGVFCPVRKRYERLDTGNSNGLNVLVMMVIVLCGLYLIGFV
jgi:hypothetical protein